VELEENRQKLKEAIEKAKDFVIPPTPAPTPEPILSNIQAITTNDSLKPTTHVDSAMLTEEREKVSDETKQSEESQSVVTAVETSNIDKMKVETPSIPSLDTPASETSPEVAQSDPQSEQTKDETKKEPNQTTEEDANVHSHEISRKPSKIDSVHQDSLVAESAPSQAQPAEPKQVDIPPPEPILPQWTLPFEIPVGMTPVRENNFAIRIAIILTKRPICSHWTSSPLKSFKGQLPFLSLPKINKLH